jgi:uncharacterized tellurite resistance protein B-like protein
MDTEMIIFVGASVALCSIVWGFLGYVYRDDADSPPRDKVPAPFGSAAQNATSEAGAYLPPPPPVSGSEYSVPAPKLKLNKPLPARSPAVASAPQGVENTDNKAPVFSLTTRPAVKVFPTGFSYHGVSVLCRGKVPWAVSKGCRLVFIVVDFNHAVEGPLYCQMPGYGGADQGFISYVSDAEPPPPGIIEEWTELAFLPTSLFIGPKSGLRSLSLRCGIMPAGGDSSKCVQVGATVFKANLELPGYLDDPLDKVIVIFSRIVELAMACAEADGVSDVREKKVILGWIEEWSRRMAGEGAECEARFRAALRAVSSSKRRDTFTLESAVFALHSYAEGQRMEALALCVRVIASDGVLHEKEMRLIEQIADLLEIDRSIMRSLFDKQFANSGIVASPDNLEAIVGIDPSWDKDRVRRHLAEQFMKWNSRAPNAKTVEEQARLRAMLDAIAKLKLKYA